MGFTAVLLALAGCDGGGGMDTDSGMQMQQDGGMQMQQDGGMQMQQDGGMQDSGMQMQPDSGMGQPDGGGGTAAGTCDDPIAVTLVEGTQTITGNTTGRSPEEAICNFEPGPQQVVALTIPGTGRRRVEFTLATSGTPADYDTVVELRPEACDSFEDVWCFDDIDYPDETRSGGAFAAEGGSTVYLVVTGFDADQSGPWQMTVTVSDANPPVLTGVTARRFPDEVFEFTIDGEDPDGDVIGFRFTLLDADGNVVGIDDDVDPDTPDITEIDWPIDEDLSGQTTFTGAVGIVDYFFQDETRAATQVRVALLDELLLPSAPITVDIRDVIYDVPRGEACGEDAICALEYECISSVCSIPAAATAACAAATELTLDATLSASATGTLSPGGGAVVGSCGSTGGPEALYTVTVPDGAFDLIASTVNDVTGDLDTVVYIQSECGDPATEVVCNDDVSFFDEEYRSRAIVQNVAAGTYTIAVEAWGGPSGDEPYQLDVRLRPVIGAGESCDPTEVENRCSTGTCAGEPPVCPEAP